MNTTTQCIILLACASICSSAIIMAGCRCINTSRAVAVSSIADIKIYDPRPYCSKKEIIVLLKDGSSRCLDPNGRFVQAIKKTMQLQKVLRAAKMSATAEPTLR